MVTAHITYSDHRNYRQNFDSVSGAQQWCDKEHPNASASVRAETTSDGISWIREGHAYGRCLAIRDETTHHRWLRT